MDFAHPLIFLLALFDFIFSLFWYSPNIFGKIRNRDLGLTAKDEQKIIRQGFSKMMILEFIPSLVMTYALAYLVHVTGAETFLAGSELGVLLALGFVATVAFGGVIWQKTTLRVYIIYVSNYLISLSIIGGVLASAA